MTGKRPDYLPDPEKLGWSPSRRMPEWRKGFFRAGYFFEHSAEHAYTREVHMISRAMVTITGTSALVQHTFSTKTCTPDRRTWKERMYVSTDGWPGVPANALKNCICYAANGQRHAVLRSIFVEGSGVHKSDFGIDLPLVRIHGNPSSHKLQIPSLQQHVPCALWKEWQCKFRLHWDDNFSEQQIRELLDLAGCTVGLGEFRSEPRGLFTVSKFHRLSVSKPMKGERS